MSPVFLYWNKHILINIPEDMHHSNCLGRWIFLKKDLSKISSGFVLFHELYPSLICITHHGTDIHRFSLLHLEWYVSGNIQSMAPWSSLYHAHSAGEEKSLGFFLGPRESSENTLPWGVLPKHDMRLIF